MGKNDISRRELLHTYTNIAALIRAQAGTPTFMGDVKKQKAISSQRIGGLRRGAPKIFKLTNKSCNFRNLKEEK